MALYKNPIPRVEDMDIEAVKYSVPEESKSEYTHKTVHGKMILPMHGNEFFHRAVSRFFAVR